MLVGPHDGGVDLRDPVQITRRIRLDARGSLDLRPGAVGLPAREPLGDRQAWPVALRQVPPRDATAHPELDAAADLPVVRSAFTPPGRREPRER